LLIRQLITF